MIQVASASAKFILCGEYSILKGGPALAFPITNKSISISQNTQDSLTKLNGSPIEEDKKIVIKKLFEVLNIDINQNLNIQSNIPIASGLGSSAALCCAIVKHFKADLSKQEQLKHIVKLENVLHGKSSGLDPTVCLENKAICFNTTLDYSIFNLPIDFTQKYRFALSFTHPKQSTKESIKNHLENNNLLLNKIQTLSQEFVSSITQSNFTDFFESIEAIQKSLESLGVVTKKMSSVLAKSKEFGAISSKMTGAGMGGYILSVIEKSNDTFIEEMKKSGINSFVPTLG